MSVIYYGGICVATSGAKPMSALWFPLSLNASDRPNAGALNYGSKEFLVKPYDTGNSENMIAFLQYLQRQCPDQRLAVIWDGASYHRSQAIQAYLELLNQDKAPDQWPLTCIRFAPNAPEQNPVEDIWLQAKRWIRECYHLCKSFWVVKLLFELVTHRQVFDFPKLHKYGTFSILK